MKLKNVIPNILKSLAIVIVATASFTAQAKQYAPEFDISKIMDRMEKIKGKSVVMADNHVPTIKRVLVSNKLDFSELSDDVAENIFHEILASYNYGLAQSGDIFSIVPTNQLRNVSTLMLKEGQKGKMFGTAIITSEHIAVNDLVAILRPLIAKYGHIAPEQSTNSVVIVDHADNIERFRQLVKALNDIKK